MKTRTRYFALGSLWFALVVLQIYHLHTGEVGWAWSTALGLVVYALGGCYFFGKGITRAD